MPRAGHRTVGSFSVSVCVRIMGKPGWAEEGAAENVLVLGSAMHQ